MHLFLASPLLDLSAGSFLQKFTPSQSAPWAGEVAVAGEADGTAAGAAAGGGATGEVVDAGEADGTGAGVAAGGGGAKAEVGAEGEARGEVPPGGETAAGEVREIGVVLSRGWYERVGEMELIQGKREGK